MEFDGMEPFPERITFSLRKVIRSQYRLSLSHYALLNKPRKGPHERKLVSRH